MTTQPTTGNPAAERLRDALEPHRNCHIAVNGHGNWWCYTCETWAYFAPTDPVTPPPVDRMRGAMRAVVEGLGDIRTPELMAFAAMVRHEERKRILDATASEEEARHG